MKLKDLKISTQLFFGFGAMFLFVIALGVVSYLQSEKLHQQTEIIYNHPLQVRRAIGSLNVDILTIRVGIRDILLSSNENQKQEIAQQMEISTIDANQQFDVFRSQYLGPQIDIDEAYHAFVKWNAGYAQYQKLIEAGQVEKAKNSLFTSESVGVLRNTMIKEINDISDFALAKGDSLYQNSVVISQSLTVQLLVFVACFLLLMFLLSYLLIRNIRNPILDLSAVTKRFRDGDLSVRCEIETRNEFGEMSDSFNSMVQSIQTTTELNEKIAAISKLMLVEEDPKRFFKTLLPEFAKHTNSQMAAVYLLSDDKKQFEHFHSFGMEYLAQKSFAVDNYEGEFGSVLSTGKIQTIEKIPIDTRYLFHTVSGKLVPREIVSIPILSAKEIIAIISLASIRTYTPQTELFIHNIHPTLSARIEGVLAYDKLQEVSKKLAVQNAELEVQKSEMESQAVELLEQNRELDAQKNQLTDANRLKTNFLSNMSHELRTPLNSVIALSGVLNRRLKGKVPANEYSYLDVIERNGKHLLSLINDILDISRIEAGHEDTEITRFSANELVTDLVSMIQPQAHVRDIELLQKATSETVFVNSDLAKCRHILQNLIGNAVKFTEAGKVEVEVIKTDKAINITVTDTGIGISEKNIGHIFDEFRQADSGTSRKYGGTGLGLAIAKKYANLLGGTITVKSTFGVGSAFTLTLPIVFSEENRIIETVHVSQNSKSFVPKVHEKPNVEKTILVVDDSDPAIIQIKDILENSGYKILTASNGSEALGIISATIPDAMILDLMMPEIDGFQVLETLRNADATAQIPVLILTAKQITKEDLKNLKRNNVHQLIQKGDVNRVELLSAVAGLVYSPESEPEVPKIKLQEIIGKPTILVVEDNPDNMLTVRALLVDTYTLLEAVDGKSGIKLAKKHIPNLILMDIALPGIDGIETFKIIRNIGELSHIPIIALTASAMTSDRETILSHGFDAYIAKPIDDKVFFRTINKVLYGK